MTISSPETINPSLTQSSSNENMLSNDLIGVPISEEKHSDSIRLYFGNPNGITLNDSGGDLREYLEQMQQIEIDLIGLSEHNLDTHKPKVKSIIYDTCRNIYNHSKVAFSSSSIPSNTQFKPGGTMLIAQGNLTSRILQQGADSFGRWSYFVLSGKHGRNIVIMSVYQVCQQQSTSAGRIRTLTATAQQTSMLIQQGRHLTPRQAFIQDLTTFIKDQHQLGHGVLIAGDFNESLSLNFRGMTRLISDCNLTDVMYSHMAMMTLPLIFEAAAVLIMFSVLIGLLLQLSRLHMNRLNLEPKATIAICS
jgi:hypothetical protein